MWQMHPCFLPATSRVRSPVSTFPSMAAGQCCGRGDMMSTAFDVSFAAVRQATPSVSSPPDLSRGDAFVKLEKVALTYERDALRVHALESTDRSIERGDFVALVGPSGCGKSTILKLVTGLLHATRGYVFVGGREVGTEPIRVGMAFQNPTLLPWLKLRENVMLPLKIVPPFRQDYRAKRKTEFRDRIE